MDIWRDSGGDKRGARGGLIAYILTHILVYTEWPQAFLSLLAGSPESSSANCPHMRQVEAHINL